MAINFLNNISLNKAQLENARVQNLAGDPSVTGTVAEKQANLGLIYFKSGNTAQGIRVFTQTGFDTGSESFSWVDVGGAITLTGDVTGSGSGSIATSIAANAVTTAKINNAAVTTAKINDTAVTAAKIASSAVTTAKINNSAVTTAKIDSLAVTAAKLATGTASEGITVAKLNTTAVTISSEDFSTNATDSQLPTTLSVKNYVDEIVTGDLVFLGGLDASTGEITSGEFATSQLYNGDTSARAVAQDRYFVVTEPGDFFNNGDFTLTLGDRVVAAVAITTNTVFDSTKIADDWTIIQSSNELATLTTVGIGNVGAGTGTSGIDVSYTQGTASLVLDANELGAGSGAPVTLVGTNSSGATKKFTESDVHSARGKKIPLTTSVNAVVGATSGGITTWTITLANAWQSGIDGTNCMVEVYQISDASTVYPEVARTSTEITVKFIGTVASGVYGVLLQNVG